MKCIQWEGTVIVFVNVLLSQDLVICFILLSLENSSVSVVVCCVQGKSRQRSEKHFPFFLIRNIS